MTEPTGGGLMARHWVQETPADTGRPTWSSVSPPGCAEDPGAVDEPAAEVHPMVPAARRPVPSETGAAEAATA